MISAQNRNFPGRSGPGLMYLASPLTVAASAVAGYIVEYEPAGQREAVRSCAVGQSQATRIVARRALKALRALPSSAFFW